VPKGTQLTVLTPTNVPAGATWTGSQLIVTADDVTISGYQINGGVIVRGARTTIRKTLISDTSDAVVVAVDYGYPKASLLLEDSEVNGNAPNSNCTIDVGWSNYVLLRDNLHDCTDAIAYVNGNDVIKDSWLHTVFDHNKTGTGIHADVLQTTEGSNDQIVHNTIENSQPTGTSGWMCGTDQGPVSNILFENNLINVSGYGWYGCATSSGLNPQLSGPMIYRNNHVERAPEGYWPNGDKGPDVDTVDRAVVFVNNVWDDDGSPIPRG
jgi:hypothetical protein